MTDTKRPRLSLPDGADTLLLHSCCAPCSGEVMEAISASGIDYSIFFHLRSGVCFQAFIGAFGIIGNAHAAGALRMKHWTWSCKGALYGPMARLARKRGCAGQ